ELSSKIFEYFKIEGVYLEILDQLEKKMDDPIGKEGISELRELYHYISIFGIEKDVKLLYSLARGLEIYTGTVFEAFTKDPKLLESSLCGGGRYDKIIGKFINSDKEMPAVGISFGLDTIYDALASQKSTPESVTQVFLIPIKTLDTCLEMATELRKNGIATEVDLLNRRVSKNMEHANRMQIPYVIIAGKRDLAQNMITLKDMQEGKESSIKREEIVAKLQKLLRK
ncbi:MAG: ATP phosphoribosyltransferase regulatory subunit, partial [Candidatus Heimdallarchaeota archaeon]|nr:ATP phosphoribosyltransferase regulatory subunit [Candidatus Heimdallarchaeota archaeon]